ncbi:MAG: M20/M25/M40 family metallo-hydrolase, partial [Myxococcales bacterium]|nr:M20/M25/M40 family metallo-hydrolase [Myxococcales bacterium]
MDWKPIIDEALRHLKALLRFDTTNPPGNEILCAQYLRDVLEAEGIEAQLLEAAPGRANLIARLAGSGRAGGPLLLTSHTDVVPAEPGHWRYPPFEATEADGFVWGRGAVDMKQMTAYNLAALLMLKRSGATLTRDVIFAAVADEEAGCRFGSTWLVDQHPELVRAEFGLNEVGGFQLHLGRRYLYPVQVAEKGFLWLRMTVHGEPGHGSMPHDRNAVVKLAAILERVHRRQLPVHIHPVAAAFVREAAETLGFPAKPLLYALLQPMATHALLKILPDRDKAKAFNAMLRNTVTPTGL